jgi:hypothetical protein
MRLCCVGRGGRSWLASSEQAEQMRRRRTARPIVERSAFAGFRFPPEVITLAVRWYLRYGLSYRDFEELLAGAAWRSITSRSTGGCSGSLRCSPTRAAHSGMHLDQLDAIFAGHRRVARVHGKTGQGAR